MDSNALAEMRQRGWPGAAVAITALVLVMVAVLRLMGRLWICSCGRLEFWAGDVWSSDNSQHLFDPYALTHVLHGLIFWGILAWGLPFVAASVRLVAAIGAEALWEVIENSPYVIQRYRDATIALGYEGDTIVNSVGDIVACGLGLLLAARLGLGRSVAVFAVIELVLLVWIRDNLTLNIVMLLYPLEGIKAWQMGG